MRHVVSTTCHAHDPPNAPHARAPQFRANITWPSPLELSKMGFHRSPLFKVSSRQAMLFAVSYSTALSRHDTTHARGTVHAGDSPAVDSSVARYVGVESTPPSRDGAV